MPHAYQKVQVWIHSPPGPHERRKVLLLKLPPDRGGFWQPVTGKVEDGEAIEQAALREVTEETSLKFTSDPKSLDHVFSFETRWGVATEFAFELECDAEHVGQERLSHEHVESAWVLPEEALEAIPFESNREALRKLLSRWSQE